MGILSCSLVLTIVYVVEADGKTCPETITLPSLGSTRDPVYEFPCDGHLIGWRAIGSIPTYNIHVGVWIPNYGFHKRLVFFQPITQSSVINIEPLIIESGDSMGFVLLKDDSITGPDFARKPLHAQSSHKTVNVYPQNTSLVVIVPHNTTRESVLNFEEVPYLLVSLKFKFLVEMDYSGRYKAQLGTSGKRNRHKRNQGKRCRKFPNCELCRKVNGKFECSLCKDGYFGRFCKNTCPEGCSSCNQSSGKCIGCSAGYFGQNCKELCPTGCNRSLGCNANSGCVECQLGLQGKWCRDVIASCDEGSFLGAMCKNVCPENCLYCNISDSMRQCIVCRRKSQWKQCINTVNKNKTEGSTSLEAILIPVFSLLVLSGAVAGVVIFLLRRRRRNVPKETEIDLKVRNGLPSQEALRERERRSNSYVDNLPPIARQTQSRQLPLPPIEDEEGYMAPQNLPDVTSPLLQEQHSDEKQGSKSLVGEADPSGPSLPVENEYEIIGQVEPIEETFE